MKTIMNDKFKRWQPLPVITIERTERPSQDSGVRVGDPQRRGKAGNAAGLRSAPRKSGDSSQTLTFTFTTQD